MTAASVPASNYTTSTGAGLTASCYTFASEPHNTNTGSTVDATISNIRSFVQNGGNFLAQCEAVNNYENNPLGRFQTTTGITVANGLTGTACVFPNADLAYSQFEGAYNASLGGSVRNWTINGAAANGEHTHAGGTGALAANIGASVSKLTNHATGSLVFYLGNHSFTSTGQTNINGMRMYLNALLIPALSNCPSKPYWTLPVRLTDFSLREESGQVRLDWTVADNETDVHFEVQKSVDGRSFAALGLVPAGDAAGVAHYTYSDGSGDGRAYYRLMLTDPHGKSMYSAVLRLERTGAGQHSLSPLSNPFRGDLLLQYRTETSGMVTVHVYSSLGALLYSYQKLCTKGANSLVLPAASFARSGMYLVEVQGQNNRSTTQVMRL